MDEDAEAGRGLMRMLRNAYSGELAAALAYRGHGSALSKPDEIAAVARIEAEEWAHRRDVGDLLERLGGKPEKLREIRMTIVGRAVGLSCHFGSWVVPMYFAGRLEAANIQEYEDGAELARRLGLPDYAEALRAMAAVERTHEEFFRRTVAAHPWLPLLKRFFTWG